MMMTMEKMLKHDFYAPHTAQVKVADYCVKKTRDAEMARHVLRKASAEKK